MSADLHNELSREIMNLMLEPVRRGGEKTEILILLESVIVGTMLACAKLGGDEIVIDNVIAASKERLAKIRLGELPTAGLA